MMIPMVGYRHFIGGSGSRNRAPQTFSVLDTVARLALRGLINGDTVVQACAAGAGTAQVVALGFSGGGAGGVGVDIAIHTPDGDVAGSFSGYTDEQRATQFYASLSSNTGGFLSFLTATRDGTTVTVTCLTAGVVDGPSPAMADDFSSAITTAGIDAIAAGSGPGDGTYLVTDAAAEGTEDAFTLQ